MPCTKSRAAQFPSTKKTVLSTKSTKGQVCRKEPQRPTETLLLQAIWNFGPLKKVWMRVQSCTDIYKMPSYSYVLQPGLDACYVKEPSHDSTSVPGLIYAGTTRAAPCVVSGFRAWKLQDWMSSWSPHAMGPCTLILGVDHALFGLGAS